MTNCKTFLLLLLILLARQSNEWIDDCDDCDDGGGCSLSHHFLEFAAFSSFHFTSFLLGGNDSSGTAAAAAGDQVCVCVIWIFNSVVVISVRLSSTAHKLLHQLFSEAVNHRTMASVQVFWSTPFQCSAMLLRFVLVFIDLSLFLLPSFFLCHWNEALALIFIADTTTN